MNAYIDDLWFWYQAKWNTIHRDFFHYWIQAREFAATKTEATKHKCIFFSFSDIILINSGFILISFLLPFHRRLFYGKYSVHKIFSVLWKISSETLNPHTHSFRRGPHNILWNESKISSALLCFLLPSSLLNRTWSKYKHFRTAKRQ